MQINNIDFPDELIESINKKELVIFAGAGVSMGPPTLLPDFANLARLIAKDTGHKLARRKDYEVFLGELKDNFGSGDGPDVNKLAADILINKCKQSNRLHSAIINLFEQPEDIKIVTTNYDRMLEKAANDLGVTVPIYDAPALPLGNDIYGIVHLHGNVNNYKYIVLTDEDFGKAYLTDGYASRFLVQLFTQYDVLFIGYSLNDTVLKYLTKAMSRVSQRDKYILTDKPKDNKWTSLGIKPIEYPENDHDKMTEAVKQLGEKSRMSLLQWKAFFEDIKNKPPKDITKESIVSYCLRDYDKTRVMTQIIEGDSWVTLLDDKGIFDSLFRRDGELKREDSLWCAWLSKNTDGKDIIFDLLAKHNNVLHKQFADKLIVSIIRHEKDYSDEMIQKRIVFLIDYVTEDYLLHDLLNIAHDRNLISLYWVLYKRLFYVKILCEKRISFSSENTVFVHKIATDAYTLSKYWKQYENELVENYSMSIIRFCFEFVESLHNEYVLIGEADSNGEPWKVSMFPLENRDISYLFDGLYVIADIFLAASLKAQKTNSISLKGILGECLNSESVFLRKLALISIRETSVYTINQKLKILLDGDSLFFHPVIQQTKKMVFSIYDKLNISQQALLLGKIEEIAIDGSYERKQSVYSYLIGIKNTCKPNKDIDKRIELLDKEYDFSSIFNPTPPRIDERFHMNSKDILGLDEQKLRDLFSFVCDNNKIPYIHELLDEISKAAEDSFTWTNNAIDLMIKMGLKNEALWNHMLYGATKTQMGVEDCYSLLSLVINPLIIPNNVIDISRLLLHFLRMQGVAELFRNNEKNILALFTILWRFKRVEEDSMDVLLQSLNTSLGILVYCCVIMISLHKGRILPNQYKPFLKECLSMKGKEYYISLCVLAGHYGLFHYIDPEWCNSVFNPILSGDQTNEEFSCSWDGFVLFTGSLNIDYAHDISKVFLKATRKMELLSQDAHNRFIDLYITLLINVVSRPGSNYIPKFFSYASDEDKRYFISVIGQRIKNMESKDKIKLWKRWLKQHLNNRAIKKPIKPIEIELQEYLEWLPHLQEMYEDAVEITCKGLLPKRIGLHFFDNLIKSNLVVSKPEYTCRLLTALCNNGSQPEWSNQSIMKIIEILEKASPNKARILKSMMIKNGWIKL